MFLNFSNLQCPHLSNESKEYQFLSFSQLFEAHKRFWVFWGLVVSINEKAKYSVKFFIHRSAQYMIMSIAIIIMK